MASVWIDKAEVGRLAAELELASAEVVAKGTKVVREAARQLRDDARSRVPVRTGSLRSSITYRSKGPLAAEVGPTLFYGRFVEHGTSKMAPQAFMGPATDAAEGTFAKACAELGNDVLGG